MGTIWISTILLRIWNLDLTVKQYLEIEKAGPLMRVQLPFVVSC